MLRNTIWSFLFAKFCLHHYLNFIGLTDFTFPQFVLIQFLFYYSLQPNEKNSPVSLSIFLRWILFFSNPEENRYSFETISTCQNSCCAHLKFSAISCCNKETKCNTTIALQNKAQHKTCFISMMKIFLLGLFCLKWSNETLDKQIKWCWLVAN